MKANLGFGTPQPKTTKRSIKRDEAAQKYEKMKADGTPDFEIYIRVRGKKQWYPVGAIAVKRSSQIHRAIFDSQAGLLQGALRLYPSLKKHQHQLEYGYRLKEFKDEPIQVAVPPQASAANGLQGMISQTMNQIKEQVATVFKRG